MSDIVRQWSDGAGLIGLAQFDETQQYRYRLTRAWGDTLLVEPVRSIAWLMLNPSTADERVYDRTVAKCVKLSRRWGYSRVDVINLFALRSTDPRALYTHPDPVGPGNDAAIAQVASLADLLICAWGTHGALKDRDREVVEILHDIGRPLHALRVNDGGSPAHPLYLPDALTPQPYTPRA